MIDYLKNMAVFARVVDEGSFRAAARDLRTAPSRVSEMVSDLESFVGLTLLHRSTRRIALTSEGRLFYARVAEMIKHAEAGIDELNALSVQPIGSLRVSFPAFMASSPLSAALGQFIRQNPLVSVAVTYSDHPVSLIEEGYDLSIRVGWLNDSAFMSRKLGEEERAFVVGKDYASARPEPQHPNELETWDWIGYEQRSDRIEMTSGDAKTATVKTNARLQVDSVDAMYAFTIQNLGVSILPHHLACRGIESGKLIQLLPNWRLRPLGFFAVWPDRARRESLALMLVRHLAKTASAKAGK